MSDVQHDKLWWPFPVLIDEDSMTDEHRAMIRFLESAVRAGLRAYDSRGTELGAIADDGREGLIVRRHRRRWDSIYLKPGDHTSSCESFGTFEEAAQCILAHLDSTSCKPVPHSAVARTQP